MLGGPRSPVTTWAQGGLLASESRELQASSVRRAWIPSPSGAQASCPGGRQGWRARETLVKASLLVTPASLSRFLQQMSRVMGGETLAAKPRGWGEPDSSRERPTASSRTVTGPRHTGGAGESGGSVGCG